MQHLSLHEEQIARLFKKKNLAWSVRANKLVRSVTFSFLIRVGNYGSIRGPNQHRFSTFAQQWILILLNFWLWSVGSGQLALVNMDVMENPPPVPVRRQKYWHLYTWYRASSSGQRGRVDQHLRFAKSRACPPANIQSVWYRSGRSAIDRPLI